MKQSELYHFTSLKHLPFILSDGYLKLTASNLRMKDEMFKPVVWMTDDDSTNLSDSGLDGSAVNKLEVKFTIIMQPHFKRWLKWSRYNMIDSRWAKALEVGRKPKHWWISEKEIPMSQVLKIENTVTGEVIYYSENK